MASSALGNIGNAVRQRRVDEIEVARELQRIPHFFCVPLTTSILASPQIELCCLLSISPQNFEVQESELVFRKVLPAGSAVQWPQASSHYKCPDDMGHGLVFFARAEDAR